MHARVFAMEFLRASKILRARRETSGYYTCMHLAFNFVRASERIALVVVVGEIELMHIYLISFRALCGVLRGERTSFVARRIECCLLACCRLRIRRRRRSRQRYVSSHACGAQAARQNAERKTNYGVAFVMKMSGELPVRTRLLLLLLALVWVHQKWSQWNVVVLVARLSVYAGRGSSATLTSTTKVSVFVASLHRSGVVLEIRTFPALPLSLLLPAGWMSDWHIPTFPCILRAIGCTSRMHRQELCSLLSYYPALFSECTFADISSAYYFSFESCIGMTS